MKNSKRSPVIIIFTFGSAIAMNANADFISDSKLNLGMRSLYYNNDYRNNSTGPAKTEEWAQGFRLDYQSGFTDGTLGFGVDAVGLLGIKLDSGKGRHFGSSMIPSDGDSAADEWSRLGLTAKMKWSETEARVGTLMPKLPILVANDGRLLPQSFQGGMVTSYEIENLTMVAGKIEQATGRGSSDRTGLAVAGGREESNSFYFGGVDYKIGSDLMLQYYQSSLKDYYRQSFLGAIHTLPISETQSLKTDLRYFRTRSQGANKSGEPGYQVAGFTRDGDGEIDNDTWSATFIYTAGSHSLLAGYQKISDDSAFVQLNQASLSGGVGAGGSSTYLYTDRLASSFTRAGQTTRYALYGYDFAAVGIPGLKASLGYFSSKGIRSAQGDQREWERDLILSYAVQSGPLKGLGIIWYNATMRSDAAPDQDQNRLVVNYSIPLI